jgi:hypothetical protein
MNTRQIIKHLSNRNGLTVSLYFPVESGESKKDWLTKIHSHLKDLRHSALNLGREGEKYLEAILARVGNFLEEADTRGAKTLAVFAGKDIFETLTLPVTLPLRVHIEDKPWLTPLTEALEENPPFLLVLIDRTAGKIIEVNFLQEEATSKTIRSDVPQRILAKGDDMGREDKTLRHIEDHLHRHLVKVVKLLVDFEASYPDGLIVIGAQKELVGKFTRLLPKAVSKKVIGAFGAEVDDNETDLIKKAQKIVDSYLERISWGKTR